MSLLDLMRIAWQGISVHKSRSFLTVLGIVIGITSIMAIMSIGESAENLVVGEIQKFGPTNIFVLPGKQPKGPTDAAGTLLNDSLKEKDLEDLQKKANVPGATRVIPYAFGVVSASYEAEIYDTILIGSSEFVKDNFDLDVSEGSFFDMYDVDNRSDVAVIGNRVREELFGSGTAIGEKIKIHNKKLQVVGVLAPQGQGSFVDFNKTIVAPYSSVQRDILGIRYFNRIIIEAESIEEVQNVIKDVKTTLRENHSIDDPEKDDFWIETQEDLANRVGTITGILTILLSSVAAVSLVVGGVGIMNIMLVSVTERTREIGLRKALGATNRGVLFQFLLEAFLLTGGGGVIGVALGTLLTLGLAYLAREFGGVDLAYVFSVKGMVWGILVSSGIGIVFGVFPARSAARKSPIEALRQE